MIELNDFYNISIRGRMAFSLCCLKTLIERSQSNSKNWEFLLDKLWTYTSTEDLSDWHEEIAEYIPEVLTEYENYKKSDFDFVSENVFNHLKSLYTLATEDVKEVVDLIFYMGTIDLYGLVEKKGRSYGCFEEIITVMVKSDINFPNIDQFKKYQFDNDEGWGHKFNREDVIC